jgi:hypothetical protein
MSVPHRSEYSKPDPGLAAAPPAEPASDTDAVEPVDFFAALTAECVPALCDGLRIDLAADESVAPAGSLDEAPGDLALEQSTAAGSIAIAVRSEPVAGEPAIAGTITCTWTDPDRPGAADTALARLIVEQAVALMRVAGLAHTIRAQRVRAANLEVALETNREIGQAIGILMATDQITADQAFDQLRSASQHMHRKLRTIAADVVETGTLAGAAAAYATSGH